MAFTGFSNFYLASDYVRTNTYLATMEDANEAARRAVNAIIANTGSDAAPCKIWPLEEPALFQPLKWWDNKRFDLGLPWSEYIPWWLRAIMVPWSFVYIIWIIIYSFFKRIFR